jgi:hypothetical protein
MVLMGRFGMAADTDRSVRHPHITVGNGAETQRTSELLVVTDSN